MFSSTVKFTATIRSKTCRLLKNRHGITHFITILAHCVCKFFLVVTPSTRVPQIDIVLGKSKPICTHTHTNTHTHTHTHIHTYTHTYTENMWIDVYIRIFVILAGLWVSCQVYVPAPLTPRIEPPMGNETFHLTLKMSDFRDGFCINPSYLCCT